MKLLLAIAVAALAFTANLNAADAYPSGARATDPSGFGLKDRFNELYSGKVTPLALTYAATTNIDAAAAGLQSITLTGNVTLTTSNLVSGRTTVLRLIASGGSRNLTFPAGWVFVGAAAPTALASGKTALLVLRTFGTENTDVVARYEVQP